MHPEQTIRDSKITFSTFSTTNSLSTIEMENLLATFEKKIVIKYGGKFNNEGQEMVYGLRGYLRGQLLDDSRILWQRDFDNPTPISEFEPIFRSSTSNEEDLKLTIDGIEHIISKYDGRLGLPAQVRLIYES